MHYSGYRFEYGIKLIVLGDGQSTQVKVDLRKQPFGIDFQGHYPKKLFIRQADESPMPIATIEAAVLVLTYPSALPVVGEGTLSPRSQLDITLLF
jgi:hypothetical protein